MVGGSWFKKPIIYMPRRECRADDPRPTLLFLGLDQRQTITTDTLDIYAVVYATKNFKDFYLEYGAGREPAKWFTLVEPGGSPSEEPQKLLTWDTTKAELGIVTLRLVMRSTNNGHAETILRLKIEVPTRTPTPDNYTRAHHDTYTNRHPGTDTYTGRRDHPHSDGRWAFPLAADGFPFFPTNPPVP